MNDWPSVLNSADLSRIRFALDFLSPCELHQGDLLRLRRPLMLAGRHALAGRGENPDLRLRRLFDPPLSSDPLAVRKFQKPSPGFVIQPNGITGLELEAGDRLVIEAFFFGSAIQLVTDFILCLQNLGRIGLARGEGLFEVTEASSVGEDGQQRVFWRQTMSFESLALQIMTVGSVLEECLPAGQTCRIEMVTPARLLHRGRLLRAPRFAQLFPFMLRRVSSLLYFCCDLELADETAWLLDAAHRIVTVDSAWNWHDWRQLGEDHDPVGGVTGYLTVEGPEVAQVGWVVALASLCGIGKGAAYGAGQLRLFES